MLRRCQMPNKVASATSTFVIAITALTASLSYVGAFAHSGQDTLMHVLSLVIYTILGVVIGGRLGPTLSARLDSRKSELLLAVIFLVIGSITLWATIAALRTQ